MDIQWADSLSYIQFHYDNGVFVFTFAINDKPLELRLSHSLTSSLPQKSIEKIGFYIGMCYLIDLAELVLPKTISIYKKLSERQLSYWQTLFEEVVIEKCYALQIPTSKKTINWITGAEELPSELLKFSGDRDYAALCLTGGKESLAILKTLEGKKPLLLFFLNPEANAHRRKVHNELKDSFVTVTTSSNRTALFDPLKKAYGGLKSGVDMAHLIFNTMLYADKCGYVLIGNEYSANFPNDIYEGSVVNHQYVKSLGFAENINNYLHEFVTRDFTYHSPFFGYYEYRIADLFFQNDRYLNLWTSCNQTTPEINFCCNCAKCAFTYLIARTKRSQEFLQSIFSRDMLQDVELYRPLMDFVGTKPLDCVGDKTEVWIALEKIFSEGNSSPVVQYYLTHIRPEIEQEIVRFTKYITREQRIPLIAPEEIRSVIREVLT